MFARAVRFIMIGLTSCRLSSAPAAGAAGVDSTQTLPRNLKFEVITLTDGGPAETLNIAYREGVVTTHPVILMMGALKRNELPRWSRNLVAEGYMLCTFDVAHLPDPDPARRPQWLYFDERFAHGYALMGKRVPEDADRALDYLATRGDVDMTKIGWLGSSSTGIPGIAVATRSRHRLAAVVAYVSAGAYRHWLSTWKPNGLWKGKTDALWPETEKLLDEYDPILRADKAYPTAILMVSGGEDKVVDPASARNFAEAARSSYKEDPDRLRLVIYDGFGHNLPIDVVTMYAEHWFRLYMPVNGAVPTPSSAAADLHESADRTKINAMPHDRVVGAKETQ